MSENNFVLKSWKTANKIPGGRWIMSKIIASKAPYFSTVKPQILEIKENVCKIKIKKRRSLENHIGTVHVIAICNQLEMCMGVLAEASIPKYLRWIPKGMEVNYTAKADSDIIGIASVDTPWQAGDLYVKVQAFDDKGIVVVDGRIKLWISEKPSSSNN
jgi:acyl-coenzyme A thioesterase PaaI-like protein